MPAVSLNCFADFAETKSLQRKISIIQTYKELQDKLSEGMFKYHGPALQALRGRLVKGGTAAEQRAAIADACFKAEWAEKRNLRRSAVNFSVFDLVSSSGLLFPAHVIRSERYMFAGPSDVSVSFCPDLALASKQGQRLVKLGLRSKPRSGDLVAMLLQIMTSACDCNEEAERIVYFDTVKGQASLGFPPSSALQATIRRVCEELSEVWQTC